MSYTTYFLLVATVLCLVDSVKKDLAKRLLALTISVFIIIQIPAILCKYTIPERESDFARTAFDYIQKHPNEAYFPKLTVLSLLGENKIYHESVGLIDRQWAKLPVSDARLRAFIPSHIQLVAFHETSGDDMHWLALPEFSQRTQEKELPGFVVYRRGDPMTTLQDSEVKGETVNL